MFFLPSAVQGGYVGTHIVYAAYFGPLLPRPGVHCSRLFSSHIQTVRFPYPSTEVPITLKFISQMSNMDDLNIYTSNLKDKYEWYREWQVRGGLKPYVDYLNRVKRHYDESKIILDYKLSDPQPGSGCLIDLSELGDNELRQIYDMNARYVYEFDPGGETKNKFKVEHKIEITKCDAKEKTLLLERKPSKPKLTTRYNDYQINKQISAVNTLRLEPSREHISLLKLFHKDGVEWPPVDEQHIDEWFILNEERDGVREQREFIKKALGTPDFAFLEGPPGSGKTTVLCELVQQLVSRGLRVLFCASTHVAVDNLLEKLIDENKRPMADLISLRIGESDKISEKTKPYMYDNFVKTKKNELIKHLLGQKPASRSQKMLLKVLGENDDTIGQIARDCANLVCGTTIGILGHPDIKDGSLRRFDFLIIDEASKTTLQEFLVPALYADRWIIVGDTKQLSPYTDDKEIAMHVNSCIGKTSGEACLDVFMAKGRRRATVVVANNGDLKDVYRKQCEKLGVELHDADAGGAEIDFRRSKIVIGSPASIARLSPPPSDQYITIRNYDQLLGELRQKKDNQKTRQWKIKCRKQNRENDTWGEQVGWRVRSRLPNAAQYSEDQRIKKEIDDLMPSGETDVEARLNDVKEVALPSVLECLEKGTGIVDRIPAHDFEDRHVRLVWQYRMHPDIAAFSHKHVYEEAALHTPDDMESKRSWSYDGYRNRSVWINVRGKVNRSNRSPSNEKEAEQIVMELERFYKYACDNPKPDGTRWTVAVLSFYAGQVAVLRKLMQAFTGKKGLHSFEMQSMYIELHTIDSFQGHEADLVFLSLVRETPTIFLNHLNRINVAITRARYQCVIVGDKVAMLGSEPPLSVLASETQDQEQV